MDQGSSVFEANRAVFGKATGSGDFAIADAMRSPLRQHREPTWRDKLAGLDLVPDLGEDIGSLRWFRGLGSLTALSLCALALLPDFGPLYGATPSVPTASEFEEARAQMIMPIAFGSDSGRRMGATDNVVALTGSPERPRIELTATLGRGDSFARVLQRAGVSSTEADRAAALVSGATSLNEVEPGTPVQIVLGQRSSKNTARPLESLAFRARFDLNLAINRSGSALNLVRHAIAVDTTPLRIRGTVGSSLYRSARAAGAPANAIQDYLKIIAGRTSLSSISASDEFDIIVDYKRAETGEVKIGDLLYAGIDRGGKSVIQMLKWTSGDGSQWFEASGVGETKGAMGRPVNGHITSGYGARRHPILGYVRMHSGLDWGAPYGSPIFATSDGVIASAGRAGGCGNAVKINHAGGLATRYCHMSRVAARAGQSVRQGQIIGYVGSSGLSTGPHLHYEMYRNGRPVNPGSVKFAQRAQLSGSDLTQFRAKLNRLKSVKAGAALTSVKSVSVRSEPQREIGRISMKAASSNRS